MRVRVPLDDERAHAGGYQGLRGEEAVTQQHGSELVLRQLHGCVHALHSALLQIVYAFSTVDELQAVLRRCSRLPGCDFSLELVALCHKDANDFAECVCAIYVLRSAG